MVAERDDTHPVWACQCTRRGRTLPVLSARIELGRRARENVVLDAFSDTQDLVGSAHDIRPVRNADARDPEPPQIVVDLAFLLDVQVCGALVEKQDLGTAIKRAREQ